MSVGQKKKRLSLKQLKKELLSKTLPENMVISEGEVIINVKKFINAHITTLEGNTDSRNKKTFMPYYDRLVKLNSVL